jgi:S-adenosylmethionine decarboxylase
MDRSCPKVAGRVCAGAGEPCQGGPVRSASVTGGCEWLVDAHGCDPAALRDLLRIRALLDRVVRELDLHVVGEPLCHGFPDPGGVTLLYLLRESHLCCHTYPESGLATFNLYCCRERPAFPWSAVLRDLLGAERISLQSIARGVR